MAISAGVGYVSTGQSILTFAESVGQERGQTRLAQVLSPPELPVIANVSFNSVYLWAAATLGCLTLALGSWIAAHLVAALCAIFLALMAISGIVISWNRAARRQQQQAREYEAEYQRYELAQQRWYELYYCARCDVAYHPHTAQVVPVTAIRSLL